MKTMKKCCAILGASALLTAPNLFASISGTGTALVDYNTATHMIHVTTQTVTSGPDLKSFDTFCLNSQVAIYTPATYNYSLSDGAFPGGPAGNLFVSDPISIGTAWLYSQFRAGSLSGYNGTASANVLLQQAIWWLEGDFLGVGGAANNSFIQTAETALSLNDLTIKNDAGNNNYGVFVLNTSTTDRQGNTTYYQPLLGIVPEPSTVVAGALLLLPFGVSTLRILRKKQTS
jgi:hypothetical protein